MEIWIIILDIELLERLVNLESLKVRGFTSVFTKRKGKWKRVKERVCNRDGKKVGVYVGSCRESLAHEI